MQARFPGGAGHPRSKGGVQAARTVSFVRQRRRVVGRLAVSEDGPERTSQPYLSS